MDFENILKLDKIYVINLEKDIEKRELMKKKLKKYNIKAKYIKAIDGKDSNIFNEYLENKIKFNNTELYRTPGAYGCLLSHIKVLEDAIENKYNCICIFQDDIIFHKDFYNLLEFQMNYINNDWDVLYLGSVQRKYINYNKNFYYVSKNNDVRGCFAFVIRNKINELLNSFKSLKHSDDLCLRDLDCNKIFLNPNLIIADVTTSTTSTTSTTNNFIYNLKEHVYFCYKMNYFNWNLDNYDLEYLCNNSFFGKINIISRILGYIFYLFKYYQK